MKIYIIKWKYALILILALPFSSIFSQKLSDHYLVEQFNIKYKNLTYRAGITNKLSEYIHPGFCKNQLSSSHIDSLIYITQPPFLNVKIVCAYDNQGRISSEIWLPWTYGKWKPDYRLTYIYNTIGKLGSILFESFSSIWSPNNRIIFVYDSLGNKSSETKEVMINSCWVNEYYNSYSYDCHGNEQNNVVMTWKDTSWVNSIRYRNIYSGEIRDSMYIEEWVDNKWLPNVLFIFGYDYMGNLSSSLIYSSDGLQWINAIKSGFNYDVDRNMTSGLIEEWNGSNWINYSRFSYEYKFGNYFTHGQNEIWQNGIWVNGDDSFYFTTTNEYNHGFNGTDLKVYYKLTSTNEKRLEQFNFSLFQNYPNPFNPITIIKYTIPDDGLVQLKVYDILGKEIITLVNEYKLKGHHEVKLDASDLPSGAYIYRINSGSFNKSGKMILQK